MKLVTRNVDKASLQAFRSSNLSQPEKADRHANYKHSEGVEIGVTGTQP